ncbi:MAG: hypothetical protein K6U74_03980 [Firmicutes bacterium]|nr:hypothetical protein [Bacillota bacterium]
MKECRWCGALFKPTNSNQKFCPDCINNPEIQRERSRLRVCRLRDRRRQSIYYLELAVKDEQGKVCPICGRRFSPRSNRQVWCLECRKKGRQAARTKYMRKYLEKKRVSKRREN